MRRGRPPRRIGHRGRRIREQLAEAQVAVLERSGGACEARDFPHDCEGAATQMHHRIPRSRGGTHDPSNLVHVCTIAHLRIHAFPADAQAHGLLASRRAS